MAFGPYSNPVQPAAFVSPLDLNMYAKGMAYKQELAEKNLKNLKDQYTSTFNLPAYGVDAEHLAKIEQEFRNKLGSMNLSNLGDMSTVSQMRGLVNQYTSGATPEGKNLLAISKRGTFYQNELKKKQTAEEKGLPYYSRSLEQLENYYNNPNFYTEPKDVSLNSGFVGVNLAKERNEALKEVPKEKYLGKDGYYHERFNENALSQALDSFYTDPRVQKQLMYDVEEKWKDKDWETEGINQITSHIENAQNLYKQAVSLGKEDLAKGFLNDIQEYQTMLQDPTGYAEQIKRMVYNQELQNRIDIDKKQSNFNSVEKATEYGLKAQELQNDLYKMKQTELFKAQSALFEGLTKEEQEKVIKQGNFEGVNLEKAANTIQTNKLKNAQAANPNYKITSSDVALDYKDEDWKNKVFVTDNKGKVKIPNNNNAKQMIVDLIKANPNDFPEIPQDMLNSLTFKDIETTSDGIEIDQSLFPFGNTPQILAQKLLQVKNKLYNPNQPTSNSTTALKGQSSQPTMNIWGRDWKMQTTTFEGKRIQVVAPQTQEDYNAIPSGAKYYDTDGQLKIKQ